MFLHVRMVEEIFILLICCVVTSTFCSTYDTHHHLHTDVFLNYNKLVRPDNNNGSKTAIGINIIPLRLIELNEVQQYLDLNVYGIVTWQDDRLGWNVSEYEGIASLIVTQSSIWKPAFYFSNSLGHMNQLGYDDKQMIILSTGVVYWEFAQDIKFSCGLNIRHYPFDIQKCPIQILFNPLTTGEIEVTPNPLYTDSFFSGGKYKLVGTTCDKFYFFYELRQGVQYSLVLQQMKSFYIINVITPVIILSCTSTIVYILPADAGEKMGVSITVLLAFAVYLSIIANDLPQTSTQICLLQVYLTVLFGITATGVILSAFVLRLHHTPT